MRKIPTLFVRDFEHDPRNLTREVHPDCKWVIDGEGTPTRKYDGTCVMFDGEKWWARREVKQDKTAPAGFVEVEHDEETGKTVGWEPLQQSSFARWHAEGIQSAGAPGVPWPAGTYELIGPKVNGNPEGCGKHLLMRHAGSAVAVSLTGWPPRDDIPRDFDGLAAWLHAHPYEGIVWHGGPDGAMAKIKKRDFPKPAP